MDLKIITDEDLQLEYEEWLTPRASKFKTPVIGTLTFGFPVTKMSCQKQCRTFHKKLSKFVYRSSYNKYKKLIRFIPFMEGMEDKDRHIHFIADADHVTGSRFIGCLNSNWSGGIKNVQLLDEKLLKKWISYISKERTKPEYCDSLILSCTKI